MTDIKTMFEYMDFCNGELRIMAGRYGGGWLACGCATIEWDFDELWCDLVGGDSDYINARDFFANHESIALIECASDPQTAIDECIKALVLIVDEQTKKANKRHG